VPLIRGAFKNNWSGRMKDRLLEMGEVYKDLRVLQLVGDDILVCECIFCKKQSVVRENNMDLLKPCICVEARELIKKEVGTLTIISTTVTGQGIKCITECSACNKIVERTWTQLKKQQSCGCQRGVGVHKDFTGKIFGELTVIGKAAIRNTSKQIQWICQCSCPEGTLVLRTNSGLRTGHPSCGCLHKKRIDMASAICKKEGIPMSEALKKVKKVFDKRVTA